MIIVAAGVRYSLVQKSSDKIVLENLLILVRACCDMRRS